MSRGGRIYDGAEFFRLPIGDENVSAGLNVNESVKTAKTYADNIINGGDIEVGINKFATCKIDSDVTGYELLGAEVLLYFTVAGANMSARVDSDTPARYGDHIELAFDPNKIHVFDKETELTITN